MENNQIDKKTFVKEKLNNFILFCEKIFGKNNVLIREFGGYADLDKNGIEPFLKAIIQLAQLFELPADSHDKRERNISKVRGFLDIKKLRAKEEDIIKVLRYLEMFLRVI